MGKIEFLCTDIIEHLVSRSRREIEWLITFATDPSGETGRPEYGAVQDALTLRVFAESLARSFVVGQRYGADFTRL